MRPPLPDGSACSSGAARGRWEGQEKNLKSPQTLPVIEIPNFEQAQKRIILTLQNAEFGQFFVEIKKSQQNSENHHFGQIGAPL